MRAEHDPDTPEGFSGADYFPDGVERPLLYRPTDNGYERQVGRRMAAWDRLRAEKQGRRGREDARRGPEDPG